MLRFVLSLKSLDGRAISTSVLRSSVFILNTFLNILKQMTDDYEGRQDTTIVHCRYLTAFPVAGWALFMVLHSTAEHLKHLAVDDKEPWFTSDRGFVPYLLFCTWGNWGVGRAFRSPKATTVGDYGAQLHYPTVFAKQSHLDLIEAIG